jgi:hypothetical protein
MNVLSHQVFIRAIIMLKNNLINLLEKKGVISR